MWKPQIIASPSVDAEIKSSETAGAELIEY